MSQDTFSVFVGYDEREQDFYNLCKFSLQTNSKSIVDVYPLSHRDLREKGYFNRPWKIEGPTGLYIDERDGKPFSTQFAHSRFLTPLVAKDMGLKGLVAFVDCDFLFLDDVAKMFKEVKEKSEGYPYSVYCVKHNYIPKNSRKMDNMVQSSYDKKLWSSLMVFDLDKIQNTTLSIENVNTMTGTWLHQFKWAVSDDAIGSLSEAWNFVPNHSEKRVVCPKAIHFTEQSPIFKGQENCRYSDVYNNMQKEFFYDKYLEASKIELVTQAVY